MIAATFGLAVVLTIGVCLASASAGFSWTPFDNAAQRLLYERDPPEALSVISSGTAVDLLLTGLLALSFVYLRLWLARRLGGLRRQCGRGGTRQLLGPDRNG